MKEIDRIERTQLERDFAEVINRHSLENYSNTPDFILAEYLVQCLENWNAAVVKRNNWFWKPENDNSLRVINPMEPNNRTNDGSKSI